MKIPQKKNQSKKNDKVDIKKYFSPPQSHQHINRPSTNFNTLEIKSDFNIPNKNRSNLTSNNNLTYLLTSNETLNLKTEPDESYYPKEYFEYFQTYNTINRNNYSEKIKMYRESLNDIVKKLNESNKKFKKIINRNNDHKENISLNNNRNKNYNEYFTKTPKYTTNLYQNNNKLNNIDSYASTQKNKNSVIKKLCGKTETRSKNSNFYLNNKHKTFTSNDLIDINKENDNNLANINKLRSEFKKISSNYLEVSHQLNTLNNSEEDNNDITYDEIIKNNSKLNDILIYNYKANNDPENEKIFILMKLRLKNAQIVINKLENEKKKYKDIYNKRNNITKINKNLENENKDLKLEIEELNNNIDLINEELEDYKNKFNNMNIFNKKIQEINAKLSKENKDLKNNKPKKNNNDVKLKELIEKYNIISEENKNLKTFLNAIQSKYRILQEIHLELKQKSDNEINSLKNEIDDLNKKCQNYEKQINDLKNLEKRNSKLKETNKKLVNEKNNIENKYQKIIKNNEENKNEKIKGSFGNLYKKYVDNKIKENKLKMIVGIYLQKQNINFNQKIKEYKDKNKKLVKSVRKLNDQIIEFKLNKLNNNNDKEENNNNK